MATFWATFQNFGLRFFSNIWSYWKGIKFFRIRAGKAPQVDLYLNHDIGITNPKIIETVQAENFTIAFGYLTTYL